MPRSMLAVNRQRWRFVNVWGPINVDPVVEIGLPPAGNGEGQRQLPVLGLFGRFLVRTGFRVDWTILRVSTVRPENQLSFADLEFADDVSWTSCSLYLR